MGFKGCNLFDKTGESIIIYLFHNVLYMRHNNTKWNYAKFNNNLEYSEILKDFPQGGGEILSMRRYQFMNE